MKVPATVSVRRRLPVLAILLAMPACGGGGPSGPPAENGPSVASVVVSAATDSIEVGKTLQLTATARDASSNEVTGRSFSWSVSDTALARVSATGLMTALGAGVVDIIASTAGKTGSSRIRLTPRPVLNFLACGGLSAPAEIRATLDLPFTYDGTRGAFANVYAPKMGSQTDPCPAIVLMPPGCSTRSDLDWAGPLLASRGYIVATVSAATPPTGDAVQECAAVASRALDFLISPANPYHNDIDPQRVGGVGYSHAARVWVLVQDLDLRFRAIAGWDNLTKSEFPDQGSPSCAGDPGRLRMPRAPALGIASEDRCNVALLGADAKKTGFEHWRSRGMASTQIVLAGSNHGDFGADVSERKPYIAYYTANWFDRWLKADSTSTLRLLASSIAPGNSAPVRSRSDLLSQVWRSAAFLDGRDCPDLRTSCP